MYFRLIEFVNVLRSKLTCYFAIFCVMVLDARRKIIQIRWGLEYLHKWVSLEQKYNEKRRT
jgi:hypothetical protein